LAICCGSSGYKCYKSNTRYLNDTLSTRNIIVT
jgi:hypothetical protein